MSGQLSVYLLMGGYMKYAEYLWSILIKTESSEVDKPRSCYTEWTKSEREKKNHLLCLVTQLCPTLCDTMDCSPPVSSVHRDSFQARTLEWVVMPSSRGSSQPRNQTGMSYIVGRFFTSWDINAYIWNLGKWYWWMYLQGRNSNTNVENRLVNTVGEGEGRMNWETRINIYTLSGVK